MTENEDHQSIDQDFQRLLDTSEQKYLVLRAEILANMKEHQGTNMEWQFIDMLHKLETMYQAARTEMLQKKQDWDRIKAAAIATMK